MNASELKYRHEQHDPSSNYFTRRTMSFFGDTMRNYGVRLATVNTLHGEVEAYELYRRRPVKCNNQESAYFDRSTFKRVHKLK